MQLVLVGGRQLPNKELATVGGAYKTSEAIQMKRHLSQCLKFQLFSIHILKLKVVTNPWAVMFPMTPS